MNKSIVLFMSIIFVSSCETKPTLQKYFVKNTESADFVAVDIAPSVINIDKAKLTLDEKAALASFDKMNILAYKTDSTHIEKYDLEIKEVKLLLKNQNYQQLMKVGSGSDGAVIYFLGDATHIDEFVVLASKKENGFAVVRVLGDNMSPTHIMNMMQLLRKTDMKLDQLKPLQELMKK